MSREQLKKLLSMAKTDTDFVEPKVETIDYDWKRPHQLTPTSKLILEHFSKKLSGDLSEEMVTVFNEELKVKNPFIHEHYAEALMDGIGEQHGNYYMTFKDSNDETAGLLVIPKVQAIQLASKMLGDPTPDQPEDYELSNLEESLLTDMCNVFIEIISKCLEGHEMTAIGNNSVLTNREWPIEVPGYESMAEIPLQIEHGDGYIEVSLIIMTKLFAPLLMLQFPQASKAVSKETQNIVIENLKNLSVNIDVHVGNGTVLMADLMSLEKGDVVVLNRKAHEPMDVIIQNKTYFKAIPTKTMNRFSLSITGVVKPI